MTRNPTIIVAAAAILSVGFAAIDVVFPDIRGGYAQVIPLLMVASIARRRWAVTAAIAAGLVVTWLQIAHLPNQTWVTAIPRISSFVLVVILYQQLRAANIREVSLRASATRSSYIAERVQRIYTPASLRSNAEVRFSTWYEPAGDDAKVGGDWFDAIQLDEERILFALGDAAGHGIEAAAAMGRVRQSILTVAMEITDPAAILRRVNSILVFQNSLVTAVVGNLSIKDREITYALAGHPPPIHVSADGTARILSIANHGAPLGVQEHVEFQTLSVPWEPGSMLVIYTDGLLEFDQDGLEAERCLLAVASSFVAYSGDDLAERIARAVIGSASLRDDVAVLAISFPKVATIRSGRAHAVRA